MFKSFNARTEGEKEFNEMLLNTDQMVGVARYRKKPDQTILTMSPDAVVNIIVEGPYESVSKYILGTSKQDDLKAMGLEK